MVLFGVQIYGSPIIMLIVMVLGTASFVGVGIIMTAIAPDQETAQMMTIILQFPMMFISGILFPIDQLPGWMQYIGKLAALLLGRCTAQSDNSQRQPSRHHARRAHTHSLHVPNNDCRHTIV